MNPINTFARTLVGSLFIVSGLIKANDAMGFSFKLGDYFAPDVLDIPFLVEYTYPMALVICIAEIMLGLATLVGAKMNLTAWSLLLMILFFDGLTFYSAYFDKVTDCGCFGDALKLTPWQSFFKDIALTVLILIVFVNRKITKYQSRQENSRIFPIALLLVGLFSYFVLHWLFPLYFTLALILLVRFVNKFILKENRELSLAFLTFVTCFAFSYHTYSHLPIRDYRPYAVEKNIANDMTLPEGAIADVYEDLWKYDVSGIVQEFKTEDKPWDIEGAVFVDRETTLLVKGDEPPIHDFSIESDYIGDLTDSVLQAKNAVLVIMYDLTKSDDQALLKVERIYQDLKGEELVFAAMSATTENQMLEISERLSLTFPFYFTDETTLKTIIRSNPGILWLREGTIIAKWHHNDFPSSEEMLNTYLTE